MELAALSDLYAGAFEYSLQAMVNGYGDFTPHSSGERLLTLILMIIGSALYGYAIGEICDKTANLNPAQAEYQQNMDLLNKFMHEIKVSSSCQIWKVQANANINTNPFKIYSVFLSQISVAKKRSYEISAVLLI